MTPEAHHQRLVRALHEVRFHLHKRKGEVSPPEVYHSIMASVGTPSLPDTPGTGMTRTLERHRPDSRGLCLACAGDIVARLWPCPEVSNVARLLRCMGWATP